MELIYLAIAIACLGGWFLLTGLLRLVRLYVIRGLVQTSGGALLAATGGLLISVGININSYQQFQNDQPIARLHFQQLAEQQFLARVVVLDSTSGDSRPAQTFKLIGDDWQVDARVLKWHAFVNFMGIRAYHKLDRISGRYHNIEQARSDPHSVYSLADEAGFDIWSWLQQHPQWQPWLDAGYGSATFLPMADNAEFTVYIGNEGLLARPTNEVARQSFNQ